VPRLGLTANLFLDPLGLLFAGMILGIGLLIVSTRASILPEERRLRASSHS
jgi:multicomponent K+:H+ antiporter subunit A